MVSDGQSIEQCNCRAGSRGSSRKVLFPHAGPCSFADNGNMTGNGKTVDKRKTMRRLSLSNRTIGRLPSILAGLAIILLPFILSHNTLDPALLPRLLVLAAILFVCNLLVLVQPGTFNAALPADFLRRLLVLALGGYVVFAAIAVIGAGNLAEAIFEFLKISLWAGAIITLIIVLSRNHTLIVHYSHLLTLVAGAQGIIALSQYSGLAFTQFPGAGDMIGTMVNKNQLAAAMCLSFPFTLYAMYRGGLFWRISGVIAAISSLAVIVLSNTRAAWMAMPLGCFAALLVLAVGVWTTRSLRASLVRHRGKLIAMVAVLIVVLGLFSSPILRHSDQQSVLDRFSSIIHMSGRSTHERIALWEKSLRMFADFPLLGVGPGNWRLTIARYGTDELTVDPGVTFYQRPHNDYLWVLTEEGVFALLCYLALFATAITYCVRIARRSTEPATIILSALLVFGLTAFMVLGFFSFTRERINHLLVSALLFGIAFVLHTRMFPKKGHCSPAIVTFLSGSIVLCSAASLVVGATRLQAEIHVKRALAARQIANWPTVIEEIDRATSPLAPLDPTSTPLAWYRGTANFELGHIEVALRDFAEAYEVNPTHIHVLNNLAACYARNKEYDRAILYYGEALALYPQYEETLLNLAATYYNAGRYDEAWETITQIDSGTADPRYGLYMEKIRQKMSKPSGASAKPE